MACSRCGNPKIKAVDTNLHCKPTKFTPYSPELETSWRAYLKALKGLPLYRLFYVPHH